MVFKVNLKYVQIERSDAGTSACGGWGQTSSARPILCEGGKSNGLCCSFLAHSSDIDDLLEGLDGVLKDWLDGLHAVSYTHLTLPTKRIV